MENNRTSHTLQRKATQPAPVFNFYEFYKTLVRRNVLSDRKLLLEAHLRDLKDPVQIQQVMLVFKDSTTEYNKLQKLCQTLS